MIVFLSCESGTKEAIEDSAFIDKATLKIKYDRNTSQIRFKWNDRLNIDWDGTRDWGNGGEELPDHPDDPLDQLPIGHMSLITYEFLDLDNQSNRFMFDYDELGLGSSLYTTLNARYYISDTQDAATVLTHIYTDVSTGTYNPYWHVYQYGTERTSQGAEPWTIELYEDYDYVEDLSPLTKRVSIEVVFGKDDVENIYVFKGNHNGNGPMQLVGFTKSVNNQVVALEGDTNPNTIYTPI